MNLFKTLLFTSLVALGASAQAEVVQVDWKYQNDRKATLHVETGLEWLDLKVTEGMSLDFVATKISADYPYSDTLAGWRFPTPEEIDVFAREMFPGINSMTGDEWSYSSSDGSYKNTLQGAYNLLGGSSSTANYHHVGGIFQAHDDSVKMYGARYYLYNNNTATWADAPWSTNTSTSSTNYGVWLVSDGGTTISSQQDPSININNPSAPINQSGSSSPSDVPAPIGFLGLVALGAILRPKK